VSEKKARYSWRIDIRSEFCPFLSSNNKTVYLCNFLSTLEKIVECEEKGCPMKIKPKQFLFRIKKRGEGE
jgi:hypothetical protein